MRIAIAGAGIAGSYLARLFAAQGIEVDLFDEMVQETRCHCRSCGWGVPDGIGRYLAAAGLDLDVYRLGSMASMSFDGLTAVTPLCTIDKPRLLRDLSAGASLHRHHLGSAEGDTYTVIIDATGIGRSFLPPCRSDLLLPTVQHRVAIKSTTGEILPAGVYGNRIPGLGYLWVFPLGGGEYHIGAGGIRLDRHEIILEEFYRENRSRFSFTLLCQCTGAVRVASPYYATPFSATRERKDGSFQRIIGVGESIGTVAPFTGEGILYSLECARLLAGCWPDEDRYARAVLSSFWWMRKERETLEYLLAGGRVSGPRLRDRWRFYRNARRSGIRLPLAEAFRRMGSLSRWVENP